jgi:hypothetical protein
MPQPPGNSLKCQVSKGPACAEGSAREAANNAIKEVLAAPEVKRPETKELKAEVIRLRKELRELRKGKAAEIRELKDMVVTYANQIQSLALRNTDLDNDACKLRAQFTQHSDGVLRPLRSYS